MSAANGAAVPPGETMSDSKGKGKAVEQKAPPSHDMSMDEDDGTSEGEESGNECEPTVEEPDEDNMEEIDTLNIIHGRRTRGKTIDYAAAEEKAKEAGDTLDDDDDEDDEDFHEAEQADGDKMEE